MVETITRLYHCHKIHKHVTVYEEYEVSGNKIILYASNGDIGDTYRVVSIKGDVVVLEVTLDEGPQYKQQITCKRVN